MNLGFSISLRNPFAEWKWKSIFEREEVSRRNPNKTWGIELRRGGVNLVHADVNYSTRCDHAGLNVLVELFGYCVDFKYVDRRHWDYERNCFADYGESGT